MQARGGALLRTGHGLAVQELVCRIQCTTFAVADSVPQILEVHGNTWHVIG